MLKVVQDSTLSAIGDSIRSKTLTSDRFLPSEMAPAISDYTVGFDQIAQKSPVVAHGLTSVIAKSAFAGLSEVITGAHFPNCETVGSSAFFNCRALSELSLPECTSIGTAAFVSCHALSLLSLPLCETISNMAFLSCVNLTELYAPSLTVIGTNTNSAQNGPFQSCSKLSSVHVPNATMVLDRAFCDCILLSEVDAPTCVSLGALALFGTALRSFVAPECESVGVSCFAGCVSLSCVSMPKVTSVGNNAFYNCRVLQGVDMPSCTYVGAGGFQSCSSLSYASLPLCQSIGNQAFQGCSSLSQAVFAECVTIGTSTFERCGTLGIASLEKCATVPERAFASCFALSDVYLPKCSYVGNYAFLSCTSLQGMCLPECRSLYGSTFMNCTSLADLSVPAVEYLSGYNMISGTMISTLSLPMLRYISGSYVMRSCYTLESLYLLGPNLVSLANVNNFVSTPLSLSSYIGSFGSIYVPEWMYSSYIRAVNWSAYSARFASVSLSQQASFVNVFGDAISIYHAVGVEFTSTTVNDGVADIEVREWSAGHEGFQVELTGFDVGRTYRISFDLQFIDTTFTSSYVVGFKVAQLPVTAYASYNDWPNNITRDTDEHHYFCVFEPPLETMYLSFELDGLTDRNNTFEIRNLMAEEVRWDL